jgi:asparagine synthase (glutamine-hydrolysing)
MDLDGWVEVRGRRLSVSSIREILSGNPGEVARFGGEFLLTWNDCTARDHFGIIPGKIGPGTIVCREEIVDRALSGGVDSSLIAALAGLPCIAIGTTGSHDLNRARTAAGLIGLDCSYIDIGDDDVQEGLHAVLHVLPRITPVEAAIGISQYLITRSAAELGFQRVLSGQGADELFGGYARYLTSPDPGADFKRDFYSLLHQVARDQAVAACHKTRFSLPYLDTRVVRAARSIPVEEKLKDGVRKWPLRAVAARHIPPEIAWYEKKAMQYGSGVWKTLQRFARNNGYKKSVQGYINQVIAEQSGNGEHDHD